MTPPALLSSVHGPLRRVLLTVPYWVLRYGDQEEIAPYREAYEALLAGLPPGAERVVATHAEAAEAAETWLAELGVAGRSRVVAVPDDLRFTLWSQDGALVQRVDEDRMRLLAPASFPREDDGRVLERVARALDLEVARSELIFQGGNLLVGDDFWLLGADALLQSVAAGAAADELEAARRFEDELGAGRRLHLVGSDREIPAATSRRRAPGGTGETSRGGGEDGREGEGDREGERERGGGGAGGAGAAWEEAVHTGNREGTRQPLFDVDTFLSLAGRGEDGRYRILAGDPRMAAELTGASLPDHALAPVFDDVARRLEEDGFRVVRNPLPLVAHDDPVLRERRWYFASSNNVVTEITDGRRRVWLPTYGDAEHPDLERTDARNAEIWRRLGFEVHALPSFHAFARGLGAVHCACKRLGG